MDKFYILYDETNHKYYAKNSCLSLIYIHTYIIIIIIIVYKRKYLKRVKAQKRFTKRKTRIECNKNGAYHYLIFVNGW